jgi:hypothetical protein
MRPLVRPYTDMAGGQWFYACGRFATEKLGEAAYKFILANTRVGDLGVVRHGPPHEVGVLITGISMTRSDVLRAARLLAQRGAIDEQLDERIVGDLAVRRARVIVEARQAGAAPGRLRIHHPGRGAYLRPDGTMDETSKGQG